MEYLRMSPMGPEGRSFNQDREKTAGKTDEAVQESRDLMARQQEILDRVLGPETDPASREVITARVFEHSAADGLKLAERMGYGDRDYLKLLSRPQFYLKHRELAEDILRKAKTDAQNETDKKRAAELGETYTRYEGLLKAGKFGQFLKEEKPDGLPARELLNAVDEWYAQFLKTKELDTRPAENDPRSKGEQLGEKAVEQAKLALEKNYYSGSVMEIVARHVANADTEEAKKEAREIFLNDSALREKYKHTGFDAYFENVKKGRESVRTLALEGLGRVLSEEELDLVKWSSHVPEALVQKIIAGSKISDERFLKEMERARYKPLDLTFRLQAEKAEKELIGEITAGGSRIVWNEKSRKYEIEGNKFEEKEVKYLTEDEILDKLEDYLKTGKFSEFEHKWLIGLDSDRAWRLRDELIEKGYPRKEMTLTLAGLDSDRAWQFREYILTGKGGDLEGSVAASLAGLDSDRAWQFREKLMARAGGIILKGLGGLDSDRAWKIREKFINPDGTIDVSDRSLMVKSLDGLDSDRAWQFREDIIKAGAYRVDWMAASLAGLDSERAWKLREKEFIKAAGGNAFLISESLAGLDSDRAWKMRDEFFIGGGVLDDERSILGGLTGLDSDRAWQLRDRFISEGDDIAKAYVALSLSNLDSDRARQMREKLAKEGYLTSVLSNIAGNYNFFIRRLQKKEPQAPKDIRRKLELLNILNELVPVKIETEETEKQPEKKEDGTEYLTEDNILDELEKLFEGEASLSSVAVGLAGLDSDRAWRLRDKLIESGVNKESLVVGLAGLDSDRAWQLREEFIRNGGNRNYVARSLASLDSERAWQWREELLLSVDASYITESLAGLDSDRAWQLRDKFMNSSMNRTSIALSLAGLDSKRAWAAREELIKDDRYIGSVIYSLAGLDSERAWQIRENRMEYGASTNAVAESLAGLDSDRAWQLRERLGREAADTAFIVRGLAGLGSERARKLREEAGKNILLQDPLALSLAGDSISFVWQLKKKENFVRQEKETKYLTEEKILDELEKLMENTEVSANSVAIGLVGCDSDRAWEMRRELIKRGARQSSIIDGLAGIDSDRAWKLREEYLGNNGFKGDFVYGLAGLDSERAWQLREKFFEEGLDKDYIARSLAGLDSDRAWKLREKLIEAGAYKENIALGLAGLDSERAWKMREEFLVEDNIDEVDVIASCVGLDSDRAWQLREKFLQISPYEGAIAQSLAGLNSDRAWQLREKLIKGGVNQSSIALGLAGLDSDQAWEMRKMPLEKGRKGLIAQSLGGNFLTFVWQLSKKEKTKDITHKITNAGTGEFDEKTLAKEISEYLSHGSLLAEKENQPLEQRMRTWLETGRNVAHAMSTVIKESPRAFLETMSAKKDTKNIAQRLEYKAFPSVLLKQEENAWRNFSGYFGHGTGSEGHKEPSPEDYLNPDSMEKMLGGDPEGSAEGGENEEVMRFREPVNDLVVTGIYGKLSGQVWDPSYQFKIAKRPKEEAREISIVLPRVGAKTKLPKLVGSDIITERVKGVKGGEEMPLAAEISPMGEGLVLDTKKAREVVYSVEMDEMPPALRQISKSDYARFKEQLVRNDGEPMIAELAPLPEEIDLFLMGIKDREPKEQVQAIEQFVRSVSYYDMKNGEVIGLKRDKPLEERLEIMEARVDELKEKDEKNKEALAGKKYAGVCADFAVLAAAILRKAGFASGVLSGFMPEGKVAKVKDAHATAFVVWPDGRGGNEIIAVDGTPNGLESISRPSLEEMEKVREEKVKEIREKGEKQLDEILQILESNDEESIKKLTNGTLEKVLNAVLRYEVKQENVQAVTGMLEAYWYSPLHKLEAEKVGGAAGFSEFFESEVKRARNRPAVETYADPGSKLFETVETFLRRFGREADADTGMATMKNLVDSIGDRINKTERKALVAITTYLQAKQMMGNDK
jgi:hypothetical protein